jgi:hypothetical protein
LIFVSLSFGYVLIIFCFGKSVVNLCQTCLKSRKAASAV